jgi:hypothetical protein
MEVFRICVKAKPTSSPSDVRKQLQGNTFNFTLRHDSVVSDSWREIRISLITLRGLVVHESQGQCLPYMKHEAFWDVSPCILTDIHWRFG